MSTTTSNYITELLALADDRGLHEFSYYWESCRDLILQQLSLEEESIELHQQLIVLQLELDRLDADFQVLVTQDKRFTNETQRKAALQSLRATSDDWISLTTEKIPQTKQALERLKLQNKALQSAYNLCYIALDKTKA